MPSSSTTASKKPTATKTASDDNAPAYYSVSGFSSKGALLYALEDYNRHRSDRNYLELRAKLQATDCRLWPDPD